MNVKKLKVSDLPNLIFLSVSRLLFGSKDTVNALSNLIKAVTKMRIFPNRGKIARQVVVWKGNGEKNCLENCRTITMARAILKLSWTPE